jgi:hypothetical protein
VKPSATASVRAFTLFAFAVILGGCGLRNTPSTPSQNPSGSGSTPPTNTSGTCVDATITQTPVDVTSSMQYVAAGVTVRQITSSGDNRINYFDTNAYSSRLGRIVYDNYPPSQIVMAKMDGSAAEIISGHPAQQSYFSQDGRFAYYVKGVAASSTGAMDIFAVFPGNSGNCQEVRITNLAVPAQQPNPVWQLSTTSIDKTSGKNIIAFSPDNLLHRVQEDATLLGTLSLPDAENASTFHRIRLNPQFPNILAYKRNGTGTTATPELWLMDLNDPTVVYNVVNGTTHQAGHPIWSPDGTKLLFLDPQSADYWMASAVNPDGSIANSSGNTFTITRLGPPLGSDMTANFCVMSPDPSVQEVACMVGPASRTHANTVFLMKTDGSGSFQLLTSTDAQIRSSAGTPLLQWPDLGHILFNSDKTGNVQVYVVTGFKTNF